MCVANRHHMHQLDIIAHFPAPRNTYFSGRKVGKRLFTGYHQFPGLPRFRGAFTFRLAPGVWACGPVRCEVDSGGDRKNSSGCPKDSPGRPTVFSPFCPCKKLPRLHPVGGGAFYCLRQSSKSSHRFLKKRTPGLYWSLHRIRAQPGPGWARHSLQLPAAS